MAGELMDLIIECENVLGYVPDGEDIWKTRAIQASILKRAMNKQNISARDMRLGISWCKHRRISIASPLQVLPFIPKAREMATQVPSGTNLDAQQAAAIAWENTHPDEDSEHWITRLVRSAGHGRRTTLSDWQDAGRG